MPGAGWAPLPDGLGGCWLAARVPGDGEVLGLPETEEKGSAADLVRKAGWVGTFGPGHLGDCSFPNYPVNECSFTVRPPWCFTNENPRFPPHGSWGRRLQGDTAESQDNCSPLASAPSTDSVTVRNPHPVFVGCVKRVPSGAADSGAKECARLWVSRGRPTGRP